MIDLQAPNLLTPLPPNLRFSFHVRSAPIKANYRIIWRLSILLLVLQFSRHHTVSLAKIVLLLDVLRSQERAESFLRMLSTPKGRASWVFRVEPAVARAIAFGLGYDLVAREAATKYKLTDGGRAVAERIMAQPDLLILEKKFLSSTSSRMTEAFVSELISASGLLR